MKKFKRWLRYFTWLKIYFSPFKPIIPKLYVGKIAIGTPYFLPRKWIKNKNKKGYLKPMPRKIGFDFVGLGWKLKWNENDFRHEWDPIWSFVFFKWQIALMFIPEERNHYWECWLAYEHRTDKSKSKKERIQQAKKIFPCVWIRNNTETICYWDKILKI